MFYNFVTNGVFTAFAVALFIYWWKHKEKKKYELPPGPHGLPILGYLPFLGNEPFRHFDELSKKYGSVFSLRIGTNYTVVLNEYSVMKEVYSNPASLDRATDQFGHISDNFGFRNLNGKPWQEQRNFVMSTMKELGVGKEYFEEIVREEVADFVKYLKTTEGRPIEISKALHISISSNILAFLIGRKLDKVKEADVIQLSIDFSRMVHEVTGTTMAAVNVPGLSKLYQFLGIAGYKKVTVVTKDFSEFFQKEVENRKKSSKSQISRDFLGIYLEEMNKLGSTAERKYFSEKMLVGNALILFLGGSDTIFGFLIWLLRLMADRKDVQDKVYKEIKTVLGTNCKAKYEERDLIPYTSAVIMEAQRYSGFGTITASRVAINDITIKEFIIPKGSHITSNLWSIHNDPNYWQEPRTFMPERFLLENGTKLMKSPPSFAPFSIGRRNCPAGIIAWMELLSYFTEIIKEFEVSTAPGEKVDFTARKGLIRTLLPQELCFKPRK